MGSLAARTAKTSPFSFTIGENDCNRSNLTEKKSKDETRGELLSNGTVILSRSRSNISKGSESSGGYSISSRNSGRGRGGGRGGRRGRRKSQGRGRGGGRSNSQVT